MCSVSASRNQVISVKGSKGKTIVIVGKQGLCTGCGTCVGICPSDSVEMVLDREKGIYVPRLDGEECNRCGLCFEVCPGHALDLSQLNLEVFGKEPDDISLGNYISCYTGYATDYNIRYNSASGGLVTALLIFALEEGMIDGAVVTRMKKDRPLEPEPFVARTREEIITAAGSKYCPVPANVVLREILQNGGKYAVVGCGCHLWGIRRAEMINQKLEERVALHIGIFCSGAPKFTATEFLLSRWKIALDKITLLEYRGKGWPGNMSLHLEDGKTKVVPYPGYWNAPPSLFFTSKCKACLDWYARLSDVSFGDAWLPEVKQSDEVGTSIVISRTKYGEHALQQMLYKNRIELHAISADSVVQSQEGLSPKKKRLRIRLSLPRFFRRKMMDGNYERLGRPMLYDYLVSILLHLGTVLASKRSLWRLLDIYCRLLKSVSRVKPRLKL